MHLLFKTLECVCYNDKVDARYKTNKQSRNLQQLGKVKLRSSTKLKCNGCCVYVSL